MKGATGRYGDKVIWGKVRDRQMGNERERGKRGTRGCFRQETGERESKAEQEGHHWIQRLLFNKFTTA